MGVPFSDVHAGPMAKAEEEEEEKKNAPASGVANEGPEVRSLSWRRTGPSSMSSTTRSAAASTPSTPPFPSPLHPVGPPVAPSKGGRTSMPPLSTTKEGKRGAVPAPPSSSSSSIPAAAAAAAAILERGVEGSDPPTQGMSFSPGALPPAPRQAPQRLREVTDSFPHNVDVLVHALRAVQHIATRVLPYGILELPHTPLVETQVKQCMECCEVAVSEATLSASYPMYCLREVRAALHSYVQGVLLEVPVQEGEPLESSHLVPATTRTSSSSSVPFSPPWTSSVSPKEEKKNIPPPITSEHQAVATLPSSSPQSRRIVSLLFTNGMDYYGNLKPTITQLKSAIQRGHITKAELYKRVKAVDALYPEDPYPPHLHHFVDHCLAITDVSDFVHITLSATHPSYQGQRLATILFTLELLKWSIRGRRRAFLNMAIEKHVVPVEGNGKIEKEEEEKKKEKEGPQKSGPVGVEKKKRIASSSSSPPPKGSSSSSSSTTSTSTGHRMEFVAPAASRRLYQRFGFREIHPRVDPLTGKSRFTPLEADMGRVMVNFDIPTAALRAAAWLEREYMGSSHKVPEERKEMDGGKCSTGDGGGRDATHTQPPPPPPHGGSGRYAPENANDFIHADSHHTNNTNNNNTNNNTNRNRGSGAPLTTPKKGGTGEMVVPMRKLWGSHSTLSSASSSSSVLLPSTATTPVFTGAGTENTNGHASERGFSSSYPECIDVEGEED